MVPFLTGLACMSHSTTASASNIEPVYGWWDSCGNLPSTADMQTWWRTTPYYGVGVYIRTPASCFIPNSQWVSAVQNQGWGIVAIWNGGRTCGTVDGTSNQGIRDAGGNASIGHNTPNTLSDLTNAGFPNIATVAIDIEGTWAESCDAAVASYLNGWVWQMGQNGATTVVYGNPYGALRAIAKLAGNPSQNQPRAIWSACYATLANAGFRGNGTNCPGNSVWNIPSSYIPDSYWCCDQRHHQWLQNIYTTAPPYGHYECYGHVDAFIDTDAGNGPVSWGDPYNIWGSSESETNDGPTEDPPGLQPPSDASNSPHTC
jgi:hypothetical protein